MFYGQLLAQTECSGNPNILIMGYYSIYIYILILLFVLDLYWWNNPGFGGFVSASCVCIQNAVSAVLDSTSSEDPPNDLEVFFA